MFYFDNFPSVSYGMLGNQKIDLTDVTKRYKIQEVVLRNGYVFYDYQVKEGERADMLAMRYYGDTTLDWLIYLSNQIVDPVMGWPLDYYELESFIIKKYGSLEVAKQTVWRYERIVQHKQKLFDGSIIPERFVVVDQSEYASTPAADRRVISIYEMERQKNWDKGQIKLLEKRYVPQILKEVSTIYE